MIAALVVRLVEAARRCAAAVALAITLVAGGAGYYAATHLALDTNVEQMLPKDLPWRQQERALDRAFPQNANLIAIVIDGETPALADEAAAALAKGLRAQPKLFRFVRRPDGGDFFDRNGILFLSLHEVQSTTQDLITAQPLIGGLAHDPSVRGLFDVLRTFLRGVATGDIAIGRLDPSLTAIDRSVRSVLDGRPQALSWQALLSGKSPPPRELRRFVLVQPVLDYSALEPGKRATDEIRRLAHELQRDPAHGVRVRMTGSVVLDDEQFATLRDSAVLSTSISIGLVCLILFAALRSVKLAGAIIATIAVGLALTAGFAALAIGSLNLISVAFAVLFVGLATDFGIQFATRYRDQRHQKNDFAVALRDAASSIHGALLLAAAATAIGFLAFLPTQYAGIAELGLIAGVGMLIGTALTFTLLPALLTLLRPRGEPEPVGFRRLLRLDQFLLRWRRWVIGLAGLLAFGGLALLPSLHFDFDPLDLQDPHSEAMQTLFDMMKEPTTSPYAAEALASSVDAARRLADRLSELPEVAQVVTVSSFVPEDQKPKLAALSDLSILLGPTLTPPSTLPPPSDAEVLAAIAKCRNALAAFAAKDGPKSPAAQLVRDLAEVEKHGAAIVPGLHAALISGLPHELNLLRKLVTAAPVSLATLPPDLRRAWLAPDGKARVEIFPRGNPRNRAVLSKFVAAIRTIAPDVTGSPVTIQESGRTIIGAFIEAGLIALAAIILLLALTLRRARDVALVVAPLLLAAILTLAATVALDMPLNYANIIALPLLLAIGVAFDIYFVMNWRAGVSEHLQSSTARAVIFSALTTMAAFGSLALSPYPGTADMGKLLALSLVFALFCTLLILPALLGPSPAARHDALPQPTTGDSPHGANGRRERVAETESD